MKTENDTSIKKKVENLFNKIQVDNNTVL